VKRPGTLYFKGKKGPDGRPLEYFAGVPARTLHGRDIARLTDEQIAEITAPGPSGKALYVAKDEGDDDGKAKAVTDKKARERERERSRARRAAKKPSAPKAEPAPAEPDPAPGHDGQPHDGQPAA